MLKKLNNSVKILLGSVVAVVAIGGLYLAYNANEHMVECKTENFYYIYGVLDENNVILLKNRAKLNEEELAALGDNTDGLIMVDTVVSEEAKQNYLPSDTGLDVYGVGNTYVYEAGIGPLKHTYEKVQDIMYLTDNTAIKLGVKEGELNYVYVNEDGKIVDKDGNIVTDDTINTESENIVDSNDTESVEDTNSETPSEVTESVEIETSETEKVD